VIAQIIGPLARDLGMQREAAARESIERTADAPIEREKPTRFAGRSASDVGSFDDSDIDAAPSQEIGGASADHAAAANRNTHLASP
jgi:hypothetical protein